jgi:(1->4)-alpha-D-glucan 1-alpha-D-glucosylmutase
VTENVIIPTATYRVQFRPGFGFDDALPFAGYLFDLGVSHLYASPVFAARRGSDHGYDVVNMNEINAELGGREGFLRLSDALREKGIYWLQDIVPNHRAFSGENPLLRDVLENGAESRFYSYFDIFWEHPNENIRARVLAPFLGDFYGRVLERGELRLRFDEHGFQVCYWEHSFPVDPATYGGILSPNLNRLKKRLGSHHPDFVKLVGIARFFDNLERERRADNTFDPAPSIKRMLWELAQASEPVREHIAENLEELNGKAGDPASFEPLNRLLSRQNYRLAYWKVGTEELNYRRFFSINDLICLRVEEEEVFDFTHKLLAELVAAGRIHGARIDHLDGLFDPAAYLRRLREAMPSLYVVVEKILEGAERLPDDWPVEGSTGYDFLTHVSGVLVDATNAKAIDDHFRAFTGQNSSWREIVLECKRLIMGKHMAGDIDNLALLLKSLANRHRYGSDLTLYSLRRALVEILAQFPVYRTYATASEFPEDDRAIFRSATAASRRSLPRLANETGLIESFVLGEFDHDLPEEQRLGWKDLLRRFQQYTGPVMAKGVEDTAFFRFARLAGLNDVGGDPDTCGIAVEEFHDFLRHRADRWPHAMNTLGTHDTKWGADTRARLLAISEFPSEWNDAATRWSLLNARFKTRIGYREAPCRNDEYLLYQALVAAAPAGGLQEDGFPRRLNEFMVKAAREAKLQTSWLNPGEEYEAALAGFVEALFGEPGAEEFRRDLAQFAASLFPYGIANSLSQLTLQMTSPGVPDLYQGNEFWDFSMVDPDNRRNVDFKQREDALHALADEETKSGRAGLLASLASTPSDDRLKLFVVRELLRMRRRLAALMERGSYEPVAVVGERNANTIAFARCLAGEAIVVVVGRALGGLGLKSPFPLTPEAWGGTRLELPDRLSGNATELFSGRTVALSPETALSGFLHPLPVAVLITGS